LLQEIVTVLPGLVYRQKILCSTFLAFETLVTEFEILAIVFLYDSAFFVSLLEFCFTC